jgi:thiamine-monophosphate kinase
MSLTEFQRIARFFKPLSDGFPGAFGLGDDAAAFTPPAGQEVVITTDAMTEGVHFMRKQGVQSIAARLMRSNLSDLAAKGAEPYAYLLTTALPKDVEDDWLQVFSQTLAEDQKRYGGFLIGGDSIRTEGLITLSITMLGLVPKGQLMRRKTKHEVTASSNLSVYVSGTIGDSALGLKLTQGQKFPGLSPEDENYLKQRHLKPEPRLDVAKAIRPFAKACIDISDGLVADVGHIAQQSNAEIMLQAEKIPLSNVTKKLCNSQPDLFETVITGGEDYELAFVVEATEESLLTIAASKVNAPLTKIGTLRAGKAGDVQVLDKQGSIIPLKHGGWTHF